MSYERARQACTSCHEAEQKRKEYQGRSVEHRREGDDDAFKAYLILTTLQGARRDNSRFCAMRALEAVATTGASLSLVERDERKTRAQSALKACESCDYFEPRIAQLLKIGEPQ